MNVDQGLAQQVAQGIGVAAPTDLAAANASLEQGWERFGVTSAPLSGVLAPSRCRPR